MRTIAVIKTIILGLIAIPLGIIGYPCVMITDWLVGLIDKTWYKFNTQPIKPKPVRPIETAKPSEPVVTPTFIAPNGYKHKKRR